MLSRSCVVVVEMRCCRRQEAALSTSRTGVVGAKKRRGGHRELASSASRSSVVGVENWRLEAVKESAFRIGIEKRHYGCQEAASSLSTISVIVDFAIKKRRHCHRELALSALIKCVVVNEN